MPDDKPAAADKPGSATPAKPAKPAAEEKPSPARAAKIVEETGRFICKHAVTFTDAKGERAHANAGDVVAVGAEDLKYLTRVGAIVPETIEE